ncbi:hypothetical protein [Sphaerochaeta sp.]|jgi:uncharacterized membrane protein HdeD (DUF308 family)|uniref:hypothetical protein n=1 Tax=Sphaerochaeta sp. TaxID=1972642 RepID=UPI002FC8EFF4
MKKSPSLTFLASLIVLSLLVGFTLLASIYQGSFLLPLMVGLATVVLSVLLIRTAVVFDRQVKKRENEHEKPEDQ